MDDFYPFVENGPQAGTTPGETPAHAGTRRPDGAAELGAPIYPARIAVYDDMEMSPRVVVVDPKDIRDYLAEITSTTYELVTQQGGTFAFSMIRELVENYIHAAFIEPTISILDHGQTIVFSDQGPGIPNKRDAMRPSFTSATRAMKKYIRGVGSGLPIVEEYIRRNNGTLTIEDNLGHGTIVTVSLVQKGASDAGQESVGGANGPVASYGQIPAPSLSPTPSAAGFPPYGATQTPAATGFQPSVSWPYGSPTQQGSAPAAIPGYGVAGYPAQSGYQGTGQVGTAPYPPYGSSGQQTAPSWPQGAYPTMPGQAANPQPAPAVKGFTGATPPSVPGAYPTTVGYPGMAPTTYPTGASDNPAAHPLGQTGGSPAWGMPAYQGDPRLVQAGGYPTPLPGGQASAAHEASGPGETSGTIPPLSDEQLAILRVFTRHEKVGPKELEAELSIKTASGSRRLKSLEMTGAVIKRGQKYQLTEIGRQVVSQATLHENGDR